MELGRLHGLLDEAMSVDLRVADLATLTATIAAARRWQAVLEARVMAAAAEMPAAFGTPGEACGEGGSGADQLRADAARLVEQAATMPAETFAQLLRREAEGFEPAGDDDARLERQKRAVRLRSFTDTSGMGRWIAHWDPSTFANLEHRVDETRRGVVPRPYPRAVPERSDRTPTVPASSRPGRSDHHGRHGRDPTAHHGRPPQWRR